LTECSLSILPWGENVNKKLLGTGIALVIIGVVLVAATVYQEQVAPPPAMPHMEIPSAKYEWRSRNQTITEAGIIFDCLGAGVIVGGLLKRRRG